MCPPKFDSNIITFLIYFGIFVVSYVSLAWYDYYSCSLLFRGKYSITGLIKPEMHEPTKQVEHLMSEKEINTTMIYWLHLLIIVSLYWIYER